MRLFIDTSDNNKTVVRLDDLELSAGPGQAHSQTVIPMIQKLLKRAGKKPADITEISVVTGPGSFTGLRVGAAVGNALGFALNVPVNGKKPRRLEIVEPTY